jgi:hypothetical protein
MGAKDLDFVDRKPAHCGSLLGLAGATRFFDITFKMSFSPSCEVVPCYKAAKDLLALGFFRRLSTG